jgi:cystathionine beta-synthase
MTHASETPDPSLLGSSVLDLIGDTPLVRLEKLTAGAPGTVLAKLEWMNPGGSIKDRLAAHLVDVAERNGELRPGGTIIEPTSGNTGAGLAMIAAQRGYRCIFTCSDKVSEEKLALLRALGARVVVCSSLLPSDHPDSYISMAARLAAEIPGSWCPDQYHNAENPVAHELSTGPEIWSQTGGRVTHLVASTGTGGTVTGTARALKQLNPSITVVAVDPVGSVYSGQEPAPYLVEGPGKDDLPPFWDPALIDRYEIVSDAEAFAYARAAARTEGILGGGSSGMVLAAAHRIAKETPGAVIVALLPDSGRAYLSKIYNDAWMEKYGFEIGTPVTGRRVADAALRPLTAYTAGMSAAEAETVFASGPVVPMASTPAPVAAVQLTGSAVRTQDGAVEYGAALPIVGWFESTETAAARIRAGNTGVVCRDGRIVGLVEHHALVTG